MSTPSEPKSHDRSLRLFYIVTAAVVAGAGLGFWQIYRLVDEKDLTSGFTNISTIGGVVGGLSLTGTAVLTLNSRMLEALMRDYGSHIRSVLFGGYCLMVGASLLCAVVSMFSNQWWSRIVLGYVTALICAGLVLTALLINSAFAHYQREHSSLKEESPIQPLS